MELGSSNILAVAVVVVVALQLMQINLQGVLDRVSPLISR